MRRYRIHTGETLFLEGSVELEVTAGHYLTRVLRLSVGGAG